MKKKNKMLFRIILIISAICLLWFIFDYGADYFYYKGYNSRSEQWRSENYMN